MRCVIIISNQLTHKRFWFVIGLIKQTGKDEIRDKNAFLYFSKWKPRGQQMSLYMMWTLALEFDVEHQIFIIEKVFLDKIKCEKLLFFIYIYLRFPLSNLTNTEESLQCRNRKFYYIIHKTNGENFLVNEKKNVKQRCCFDAQIAVDYQKDECQS